MISYYSYTLQDHAALSSLLAQSNAICIEGSRSAYATNSLPWSNNNYTSNNDHVNQRINIAKKEAALKSVIKKEVRAAQKLKDKQMEMDGRYDIHLYLIFSVSSIIIFSCTFRFYPN